MSMVTETLGWTLVHTTWQFTIIGVLAYFAMRLLQRSTSQTRYRLWLLFMASTIFTPLITAFVIHAESTSIQLEASVSDRQVDKTPSLNPIPNDAPTAVASSTIDSQHNSDSISTMPREAVIVDSAPHLRSSISDWLATSLRPKLKWVVSF